MPRNPNASRDIPFGSQVYDELPETPGVGILYRRLEQIIETPELHGKYVGLKAYIQPTNASAAKTTLRARYGDNEAVAGWTFETARSDEPSDSPEKTLFARYRPDKIVEGARAEFEARVKARKKTAKTATKKVAAA